MNTIEYILNYEFHPLLLKRVQERLDCSDLHMVMLSEALKDYFIARFTSYNNGLPVTMPSCSVDELWHEFIIFTRDYTEFCNTVFGAYLHHDPYGKFDIRTTRDEGMKNTIDILNNIKKYRTYKLEEIDILNEKNEGFYLLFAMDYIIHDTPYDRAIEESLKDIKGAIDV